MSIGGPHEVLPSHGHESRAHRSTTATLRARKRCGMPASSTLTSSCSC